MPGVDSIRNLAPISIALAFMFFKPLPLVSFSGSNPFPLSVISIVKLFLVPVIENEARSASAYSTIGSTRCWWCRFARRRRLSSALKASGCGTRACFAPQAALGLTGGATRPFGISVRSAQRPLGSASARISLRSDQRTPGTTSTARRAGSSLSGEFADCHTPRLLHPESATP